MKVSLGIKICGSGSKYDSDLNTYIQGLSTPLSTDQLILLNDFIIGIKSDLGIEHLSDGFDVMWYEGNETIESSCRNMVKRQHDFTLINSPTHIAYEGFTGGAGKSINTNYNPSTQGINFKLNDASTGIYCRTIDVAVLTALGLNSGADVTAIHLINGIVGDRVYINSDGYVTCAIIKTAGMWIKGRSSATLNHNFCNKSYNTGLRASTAIANANIHLLSDVALSSFSLAQQSFAFAGKYWTEAQMGMIQDRFETLMDANGKGVIP